MLLRGGFGWYCFVFVLDAVTQAGGLGIPCMGIGHERRVLLLYPLQAEIVRSCPSPSVVRQPFLRIVAIPARSAPPGCPARSLAGGGQSAPPPPSLRRELDLGTNCQKCVTAYHPLWAYPMGLYAIRSVSYITRGA